MRKKMTVIKRLGKLLAVPLLMGTMIAAPSYADNAMVEKGKKVAFDRKKGNCLACHMIADGTLPGNQGPALIAMKARFPDPAVLKAQISNPLEKNPNSIMPPFGLHNILSEEEIDAIVEYLLTL
ncbi:MAG: sulfur oxidation c-type cytochrome SoxX [Acidiferrobacterales bacterium]|nr:sulfur oxidation c-type cytochrome SoxX [Acidiferrobacterales bacterium]